MRKKMKKALVGIVTAAIIMSASVAVFASDQPAISEEWAKTAKDELMAQAEQYYATHFDWEAYRKANPDLEEAFGDDEEAYRRHYIDCGIAEGRASGSGFDAVAYIINNFDYYVENALNNPELFNSEKYMQEYDLETKEEALLNWLIYGAVNNRTTGTAIDPVGYAYEHPDAQTKSNITPDTFKKEEQAQIRRELVEKYGEDYVRDYIEAEPKAEAGSEAPESEAPAAPASSEAPVTTSEAPATYATSEEPNYATPEETSYAPSEEPIYAPSEAPSSEPTEAP